MMRLLSGSAGVPPAVSGLRPKTSRLTRRTIWFAGCTRKPVGGTPTGATGTVALPIFYRRVPAQSAIPSTGAHKIADHGDFLFAGDGVRLHKFVPFDGQAGGLEQGNLPAHLVDGNHGVARSVRHEQALLARDGRKFPHQFFRLINPAT